MSQNKSNKKMREILEKYAKLILSLGVNLKEGQNLIIQSEPVHWDFIILLGKLAFQMGARYVKPMIVHAELSKARVDYQKEDYLGYIPTYYDKYVNTLADEGWAMVYVGGLENPDVFATVDQTRNAKIRKALLEVSKPLMNARLNGQCPWTIADLPTKKWAAKVFGSEPTEEAREKLWRIMVSILRLDHDDPLAFWKGHAKALKKRADTLNSMKLDFVTFKGPDTNLKVCLTPDALWLGGSEETKDRREYFPNLPTEEVFTTPDYSKTQGKVKITRPVMIMDQVVKDLWLEFKDGRVVNFGAKENVTAVEKYFEIDQQNRYLGELALVDISSPIYQCGKIFSNILYDENASCHIALGRGFGMCVKGGNELSEEELKNKGCNNALMHIDVMIGSEKIQVSGQTSNGDPVTIIKDGSFVI